VRLRTVLSGVLLLAFTFGAAKRARGAEPAPGEAVTFPDPDAVTKARALEKYGDRKGAIRMLAHHLETTPGDTAARALSGALLLASARYEAARAELALVLRDAPENGAARRDAIHVELQAKKPERAIALASEGLAREPKAVDLYVLRGRAYAANGSLPEAQADFERAAQLDPHDREAAFLRRWTRAAASVLGVPPEPGTAATTEDPLVLAAAMIGKLPRALTSLAILEALGAEGPAPRPTLDILAEARRLSTEGDRKGGLRILRWHLEASPEDTDARTLYGTMLSWEGLYKESRAELAEVMDTIPGHGDAIRSAVHVELWSDHPERAVELADEGLRKDPDDIGLLLDRARGFFALNRLPKARADLDHIDRLDPGNKDAASLRRRVDLAGRVWAISATSTVDAFSGGTYPHAPAFEEVLGIKRETPIGSIVARTYGATRFGEGDALIELEAFPTIRKGTYADVGLGIGVPHQFYPQYRLQLDVYQTLPLSFEASLGYRRLQFNASEVDMGVVTVSKYFGDWLLTLRSFIVPNYGTSVSVHGSVRRYLFDSIAYVGLRYGYGLSKDDIHSATDLALLNSNTGAAEASFFLFDRYDVGGRLSVSQEQDVQPGTTTAVDLWQYEITLSGAFRF
jgi:YaiO family outer membrane protein